MGGREGLGSPAACPACGLTSPCITTRMLLDGCRVMCVLPSGCSDGRELPDGCAASCAAPGGVRDTCVLADGCSEICPLPDGWTDRCALASGCGSSCGVMGDALQGGQEGQTGEDAVNLQRRAAVAQWRGADPAKAAQVHPGCGSTGACRAVHFMQADRRQWLVQPSIPVTHLAGLPLCCPSRSIMAISISSWSSLDISGQQKVQEEGRVWGRRWNVGS